MASDRSKKTSVLLFEDDNGQALLTREALEREGFTVEVCGTGRAGLARMLNDESDVCLIDMKLPDIGGIEVLRRLTTIKPGVVAIIVTAHGDEAAAVEAMKLGAADYIVKSTDMAHLTALPMVIHESLERVRLLGEREALQTEVWEHARLLEERNAELRRLNQELRRLDQLKSELLSTVSHELRTPLATVKEFASIVSNEIAGPVTKEQEEYLGIIQANLERLSRIIDDLLDMAKLEAGRVVLNRAFVEPDQLLGEVVKSLRPLAESKQLELVLEVPSDAPRILADADRITQVVVNLVSNAIKYTNGPGRITVALEEHPNEARLRVQDTGIGIAPEDLPKLFEKFQQFQRTSGVRGAKGTGLGLAISKRLVELHGGRIWAESTPGTGSVFTVSLPKYHKEEVFHEYLKSGIERAKLTQSQFSILIFAIVEFDRFKGLYGLEEASRLLRDVEDLVRDAVRRQSGDVVTRWQRGEMVVILAEVDQRGARAIGERVKGVVEGRTLKIDSKTVTLRLLVATATYPDEALDAEELLALGEQRIRRFGTGRARIMVVDDEPKLRKFLKEALELREYDVVTAASGPEALEQLKRQPVDLLLLDVMMPVMDGYEVYHLLKEDPRTKRLPVLIVTARGERKDRVLGLEHASYNYIAKPFQLDDLLAKVREILQQKTEGS